MLTSWPTMAGDVYWHSMPAHSYTEGEYRHPNVVGLLHSRDGGMPYRCPTKPLSRLKKLLEERSSVNRECQSKSTQIRGAQFELRLMAEQCALWGVQKSHTPTPPANRVVERGNRDLGNMMGMIRLGRNKEEWDLPLPQIMWTIKAFSSPPPPSSTSRWRRGPITWCWDKRCECPNTSVQSITTFLLSLA